MEEYQSNSYRSKIEKKQTDIQKEKNIQKVIKGSAKSKKKTELQKFADNFISEDVSSVKHYVFSEVLIPAIKKALYDVVINGAGMFLYGETHSNNNTTRKVSYGNRFNSDPRKRENRQVRRGFDYDELLFETRGDAESVLDSMNDIISQYEVVSVGDLYDLADVDNDNYAAYNYGWYDIQGCRARRVRDGYVLELPKAKPIN